MTQPSKFTEARRKLILAGLSKGLTRTMAAYKARINPETLRLWTRQGESDIEAGNETEYAKFVEDMAETEAELLESFTQAMVNSEHLADRKWIVTRLFRKEYNDNIAVDVNAKVETVHSWKDMVSAAENEE